MMRKIKSMKERFESKFKKTKNCWIWMGYKMGEYGGFYAGPTYDQKYIGAHRASYSIYIGKIGKLDVLHKCDNPICVNPKHLFLGTHRQNMEDKVRKRRQPYGSGHSKSKLTEEIVKKIRNEYSGKYGELKQLCIRYNVFYTTMYQAINKLTWKHI